MAQHHGAAYRHKGNTMTRYTYAYGYKTRDDAREALADMFCEGTMSQGDLPEIVAYSAQSLRGNVRRYMITCAG